MSGTIMFKCPSCGGNLEYDPTQRQMRCPYCDTLMEEGFLDSLAEQEAAQEQQPAAEPVQEGLRSYHCKNCGAEITTGETTAATRCYFCHSPVVLEDRVSAGFRPDMVIPFKLDKSGAEKAFEGYLKTKRFLDRRFLSPQQREDISGVYYPYWLCDEEGVGDFSGTGTRVRVQNTPREIITTTDYYQVTRKARLSFRNLYRKALNANSRQLTDGIFPYEMDGVKPFAPGYLSGFLAEKRDVEESDAAADIQQEVRNAAPSFMESLEGFNSLQGNTSYKTTSRQMHYALFPAWTLTYKGGKNGAPYYFMMNGQTGKTCGKLPLNQKKLLLFSLMIGSIAAGLLCLGGAMLW